MKKVDKYKEITDTLERFAGTKGHKKVMNYIKEAIKSDYFQSEIGKLRKKYSIPANGFKSTDEHIEWNNIDTDKRISRFRAVSDDVWKLCAKINLHNFECFDLVESYLYFNNLLHYDKRPDFLNLCIISDTIDEIEDPLSKEQAEGDNRMFPIAIRISPYASLRNIQEYLEVAYATRIKPLQEKYKKKNALIGRIKSKNPLVAKRNDFIYKNKDLPRKKIKELVEEKFDISLEYEYIGKIISDEKKKRKIL